MASLATWGSLEESLAEVAISGFAVPPPGGQGADGSRIHSAIVVLAVLWIIIRAIAGIIGELLAVLAKLVGILVLTTALFAFVTLTLAAHLTGGRAANQVHQSPTGPIATTAAFNPD